MAACGNRARRSWRLGLYFMVQLPQRIEVRITLMCECREVFEVPHDIRLSDLGQRKRTILQELPRDLRNPAGQMWHVRFGKIAVPRPG